MALPQSFVGRLTVPIVAAPMFLISGPDLVVECCRAGVVGTFPALNRRTTEGYAEWLAEIAERLAAIESRTGVAPAPFGVNLVIHKSNRRLEADLAATLAARVPLVVTSLGLDRDLIRAVHEAGGLVFHDVTTIAHARKAAEAGVDGLIAVCHGAGGHAGRLNPLVAIAEIRRFFAGTLLLAGTVTNGVEVAAARLLGADMAYVGTRFMATRESLAASGLEAMLVASGPDDIVYAGYELADAAMLETARRKLADAGVGAEGVPGNFLRPSIVAAGRDPDDLSAPARLDLATGEAKAWKDIWAAGQGVGGIDDIPGAGDLCARFARDYRAALDRAGALLDEPTRAAVA